jgi:hypothetical protein
MPSFGGRSPADRARFPNFGIGLKIGLSYEGRFGCSLRKFVDLRLISLRPRYNLRTPASHYGLWLSLARAPRSGRGGRGFESHQPDCA